MKDVLSFKTALALKQSGFPQPEFGPGQFWYDEDGSGFFVVTETKALVSMYHMSWRYRPESKDVVTFAPSVTDMMRELPGVDVGYREAGFVVIDARYQLSSVGGTNIAEVLAQIYLERKATLKLV